MHKEHGIVLGAGALQEMLALIVPRFKKRRKNKTFPVTLSFDTKTGELFVEEARHGLSSYRIPAVGGWPEKVQVDGTVLKLMCDTFGPDDIDAMDRTGKRIQYRCGSEQFWKDSIVGNPQYSV